MLTPSARAPTIVALFLAVFPAAGCARTFDASSPVGAVRASNQFGFELYTKLRAGQDNVVSSPAGASIAMVMASAGARGQTLAEMTQVLHLEPTKLAESHASFGSLLDELNRRDGQQGLALQVADQLGSDETVDFESDFLSLLDTRYRAPLERVDFLHASEAARGVINRWGALKTHDRIREIMPPGTVHAGTRLVITNSVYFKGAWVQPFAPHATADRPFYSVDATTTVPMMAQFGWFRHASARGVSLVELPYKGDLSMVVILPDDADGLEAVERRLSSSYDDWLSALTRKRVDLWLPRWKFSSQLSLGEALEDMGMTTAFGPQANFTGMTKLPIVIDKVLQQAFVEVDEVGTEAAAVTAVAMEEESAARVDELKPVVFHAEHPFAYVIRDLKTGVVLFAGRVSHAAGPGIDPTR